MSSRRITLMTDKGPVWKLYNEDGFNKDFILGFMYGGMFKLQQISKQRRPYFTLGNIYDKYDPESETYSSVADLDLYTPYIYYTQFDELEEDMQRLINDDMYLVALRTPNINGAFDTCLILTSTLDFFQGLFTALNNINKAYNEVILYKPIKAGISYNIEGVTLPDFYDTVK